MRIESDLKLGFKDVLIRPKRSTLKSRSQVSLHRTFKFCRSGLEWTGIPIMAANMDTVGTFAMALALAQEHILTMVHKHYSCQQWLEFCEQVEKRSAQFDKDPWEFIGISTGTSDLEKITDIIKKIKNIKFICIDVANGYSEHFVKFVKTVRDLYPEKVIIAGNVVTGEMVEELILSGADMVKVGIGPGSVCTTRLKTGVGYPQVSAVIECADAAHGLNGLVISDGGHVSPGDVAKSFGAGADFVMLGGMLAGHIESGGQIIEKDGQKCMEFYGMSSEKAMQKHAGGVAEYRASEGKSVLIPYRGEVNNTVKDILGGLRSACTYVGASQLKELSKRTTFIRVLEQENKIFQS